MEQATNQFTKGLQMDSHPMVQGNDTLTDCLNGTLITMNGNEVILQNDMGNRRVDKAFLPPGYEPVGMKEYGGIIYVAAYNPITNKSQIGSFPSPQKKLSSVNNDGYQGTFNFGTFTGVGNVETDPILGIDVIKSDSFMLPLTKDLSLRAGDKFAIYSEGLSELSNLLTNYNNTAGTKAYSPKNRKYTLQLGVLNSQNEFVDITKTLCRWKDYGTNNSHNWQTVKYDSEVSEIFKFNDGYFISDAYTNTFNSETIDDANLIKERQKIAANTYAYKLVGPLYLKLSMNHIENFNYNIYGTYDNNTATLWIEGFITYNCPDGAVDDDISTANVERNSNEDYATFNEGIPGDGFGFDLIGKTPSNIIIGKSTYNPNNNNYTVKIIKKYENITGNNGGNIFNYTIGVKADIGTSDVYIRGLSVTGSIDLSLFGSGTLKFNGWRFYNNLEQKSTILTYAFNAYPEYGKSFSNLKFEFKNIRTNTTVNYPISGFLPLYNGKQTINFQWADINLQEREIYQVTASYQILDNELGTLSERITVEETQNRWLLTTELFNEFYQSSANIADFCNVDNVEHPEFYDKMNFVVTSKSNIINRSKYNNSPGGALISNISISMDYYYKHEHTVIIDTDPTLEIKNSELYPNNVKVKDSCIRNINISSIDVKEIGNDDSPTFDSTSNGVSKYNSSLRQQLKTIQGSEVTTPVINLLDSSDILLEQHSISGKTINGLITYYDRYKGLGRAIPNVTNAFEKFDLALNDQLPTAGFYGGVAVNYDHISNWNIFDNDDYHYIDAVTRQANADVNLPRDSDHPDGWHAVANNRTDSRKAYNISKVADRIFQYFNAAVENSSQSFLYLFVNGNYYPTISDSSTSGKDGRYYTRVWWQMPNGEWAVFPQLFCNQNGNTISDFIKQSLGGKTLVYCMYNSTASASIYAAEKNYIYYDTYSIPFVYNINYTLSGTISDLVTTTSLSNSNLSFVVNNTAEIIEDSVEFELNSAENFFEDINRLDPNNISNVYVQTGQQYDSLKRKLNPAYIYYIDDNNELVRINSNNFYIDTVNLAGDGKNRLLYNKVRKSTLYPRYQSASSGDSHTVLAYDSINVVDSV